MTQDQAAIFAILAATMGMFLWGRWRHDMVAAGALLASVIAGLTPSRDAFSGFGHPAVVTVACVLILSRGLQNSGAVDALAQRILPASANPKLAIASLTALGAALSAFMNNVGALALLMPVAVQTAERQGIALGRILMPLAFGSILGGMTTLIGTPPNLIVSGFRAENSIGGFDMFDFTPVGLAVAVAGVAFIILVGWRLVPARERAGVEGFETGLYLTEARVPEDGKIAGMRLREIEEALGEADAQIVGFVRHDTRVVAPSPAWRVRAGDILVIEAEPEALASVLSSLDLKLEEEVHEKAAVAATAAVIAQGKGGGVGKTAKAEDEQKAIEPDEMVLMELAVMPDSGFIGRSATDIGLRTRFGVNLLALSRVGRRSVARLRSIAIRAGDVLLMQGTPDAVSEFASQYGCLPLAKRPFHIPDKRRAMIATAIIVLAVGVSAFGLLSAAIAFTAGALATMAFRVIPPRSVYNVIDWPVIVLLGALIPVARAMETTGAAVVIGRLLLDVVAQGHATVALVVILIVTMILSDFMNNAATAAVMCPIAFGAADQLGASADPFLMAVAVGASCAFLTPIGHQNNTLILGPGGFRFGDYWRLGLPLEILIVAIGVPMILLVWPL
jgi:di/tricarboxylate transporter